MAGSSEAPAAAMKISVNTLFLIPGEVGGAETYLCGVLDVICAQHPEIALTLHTNAEGDEFLRRRYGRFPQVAFDPLSFRASSRYSRILREQAQLPRHVRHTNPDVLWSPGYTAPYSSPCPQVVSILDMQYRPHPEDLSFTARLATHILVSAACRRAERIITLSEFARREIVRYTHTAEDRIVVTPLAADPQFAQPAPEAAVRRVRERWLRSDAPYLLCVANTYPHKNVPALIAAFGALAGRIPHRLVLAGKPRLGEPAVQRARAALSAPDRVVRITDRLEPAELRALYQGSALFVFPSLYEGFGLPVLEAMLAGVPVLATRRASIPEVGADAVRYFDDAQPADLPEKVMAMLALPADERARWCARAQAQARTFTWERTAALTIAALRTAAMPQSP